MTPFQGFPAGGRVAYTPIPDVFFSSLLPQITDAAELKATLYVIYLVYHKKGFPRFAAFSELAGSPGLMEGLTADALKNALTAAVARGSLLSLGVAKDGAAEDVYFVNTDADRQAVERIRSGELKLAGLRIGAPAPLPAAPPPDIFTLYEQNIGMLTPMIADELKEAEKLYPADWLRDAIKEAAELNKRNIRYITRILENWSVEGRSDGTYQRDTKKAGPDKYFKGKYGHMVRR